MQRSPLKSPSSETSTVEVIQDDHRLFQNRQRRLATEILQQREDSIGLVALAQAITASEHAGDTDQEPHAVAAMLHHVHLPMLADAGILDYDPDTRQIAP